MVRMPSVLWLVLVLLSGCTSRADNHSASSPAVNAARPDQKALPQPGPPMNPKGPKNLKAE